MNSHKHLILILILFLLSGVNAKCQSTKEEGNKLELASLFQDGMVLQRDMDVPVWGWGTPETGIKVSIQGRNAMGTVKADSTWSVVLPPLETGGPFQLEITDGEIYITIFKYRGAVLQSKVGCPGI